MAVRICRPRLLTPDQAEQARRRSSEINPSGVHEPLIAYGSVGRRGGRRLVVDIAKKWPRSGVDLSVQFLDSPSKALRARIVLHMNAWAHEGANIRFRETRGTGEVRVARLEEPELDAGYWSYVGTEILGIEEDAPTMNLEGFTMRTPDAEFRRVVRHEAGHTLGFEHEHMRQELVAKIDRKKAFAYFARTERWTRAETSRQVLTPLAQASVMGTTEADPLSIMCYQIPAGITKDRLAIKGGSDINPKDYAFAGTLYPARAAAPAPASESPADWGAPRSATRVDFKGATTEADTFHLVIMDRFAQDATAPDPNSAYFVRLFASYGGARVTEPMQTRAARGQPPTRFNQIIRLHERIKNYTSLNRGTLPEAAELLDFGAMLFDVLIQGDVRRLYDEARARQQGRRLDFVLTSMVSWIAEKPWEFAYDRGRGSFLATEDIHFVRNVLTSIPADCVPDRSGPLRILVASAQPVGMGALSVDQESEIIQRSFQSLIEAGLADVDVLPRATPGAIHARLTTGGYAIVHFIGHGEFDEDTREGCLIFEDGHGGAIRIGERSVRELFCRRGVSLIFLNACQTGTGGRADFNKGTAQALMAHGLPALVANQYAVLDASATEFARQFYWSLAQGVSIAEAAHEARIAVNYLVNGEAIDWAVPVLYARDPSMVIAAQSTKALAPSLRLAQAKRARGSAPSQLRVAVWDIDGAFPALDSTLGAMTKAQTQFHIQRVDLSAPLDAWYFDPDSGNTPYVWAEKLAERLRWVTAELRVDQLVCLTRRWICSDDELNLFAWLSKRPQTPLALFSYAGFEDLPPAGPATDTAVARAVVCAVAARIGDLVGHDAGPVSCPLWRNRDRAFRPLIRPMKLDGSCRTVLKKRNPAALAALDALTSLFHDRRTRNG